MIYIIAAFLLFIIDAIIKKWIHEHYSVQKERRMLASWLGVERLDNPGAAMGMLGKFPILLKVITGIILGGISIWGIQIHRGKSVIEKIAYVLLSAGAFNNGLERICHGKVTDYIRFHKAPGKLKDIVFNLSDFFIMIGGFLVIILDIKKNLK